MIVVLCVTGGIAAYKSAALASMLKKKGHDVHVVMTHSATKFITPLTFETITGNMVYLDTFSRETPFEVSHVSLAKKAQMCIVAPATANIIAKMACGLADDFMSTFLLAARCPIHVAPAMNTAMYEHTATQNNIQTLKNRGVNIIDPDAGMLACGDTGKGRMPEPQQIIDAVFNMDMQGLNLLVTAGATKEAIDDVRYITNKSSGKMGYAMAKAAADRGAHVTLISGSDLPAPGGVSLIKIVSAQDMFEQVVENYASCDVVIKCAAVADYTPQTKISGKLKKSGDFDMHLVRTQDILKYLGEHKENKLLVGFAAETDDVLQNAQGKLEHKNLDIIVANDVSKADVGFASEHNEATIITKADRLYVPKCTKYELANKVLDSVLKCLHK